MVTLRILAGSPLSRQPLGSRVVRIVALGLATLCLLVAGAVQGQVEAPRSASWAIVPGRAIGPVALGMTREDVKAAVGDPDKTTEQKWGYSGDSLFVAFSDDNHVVTIEAGL